MYMKREASDHGQQEIPGSFFQHFDLPGEKVGTASGQANFLVILVVTGGRFS